MPTERLYYTDCYLREFDAEIVGSSGDRTRVYLNRTGFYPTSGGQPHDLGVLGGRTVVDVIDEDGRIAHLLSEPLIPGPVRGEIDWRRRYDHMQQHTGQHLLSAVFANLFGYQTVSFHLGTENSTIELATKELSEAEIVCAEENANEIVRSARPVAIRFEAAEAVQELRKPSSRSGMLRIIEIDGLDRSACGGTHVRSTAEIGLIQIRGTEKIRANVRVEFVCGLRALKCARRDYNVLVALVRQAAVPIDEVTAHFASLRQRLLEAEKQNAKLMLELARIEGARTYTATAASSDGLRRLLLRVPTLDETARAKAQAFAAQGFAIALVIGSDCSVLVATSPDAEVNAASCLKRALAADGGRGGGSATLAQGRSSGERALNELEEMLGFRNG